MYGFLNINKPKGWTSFDVIRQLKRIIDVKKIGHTGTLDPLATGVLVVAIGEATKLIEYMMKDDKEYIAGITLGSKSNTYDAEGEISHISNREPVLEEIEQSLYEFEGEIDQIPPAYSALKIKGKRAYSLARKGEEVEMKSRKVQINKIDLISYEYPLLKIDVECHSGTYIRSIAHDLGEKLDVGAYLSELLRTRVGIFKIEDSIDADNVDLKKDIIPVEKVFEDAKKIELNAEQYAILSNGGFVTHEIKLDEISFGFFESKLIGIIEKVPGSKNEIKFRKKLNID